MKKVFTLSIVFLIGLLSGYCFIVFAGYTASWTHNLIVITANILKEYQLSYMLEIVDGVTNFILLIFTAIPVFFISGLLLAYYFKHNIRTAKWDSSLGLLILPFLFAGFPALYHFRLFDAFSVLAVPLFMNLLFINKISSIINAPNKNE